LHAFDGGAGGLSQSKESEKKKAAMGTWLPSFLVHMNSITDLSQTSSAMNSITDLIGDRPFVHSGAERVPADEAEPPGASLPVDCAQSGLGDDSRCPG